LSGVSFLIFFLGYVLSRLGGVGAGRRLAGATGLNTSLVRRRVAGRLLLFLQLTHFLVAVDAEIAWLESPYAASITLPSSNAGSAMSLSAVKRIMYPEAT
jgi:hypothetical protein